MSIIIQLDGQTICNIQAFWVTAIVLVCVLLAFCSYKLLLRHKISNYKIDTVAISSGGISTTIKRSFEVRQIAYSLWVELQTRKIGILIDLRHDVIDEIYKSWYTFFTTSRELLKAIPADEVQTKDAIELIKLTNNVLNNEMRGHLTKWQAKYRHWHKDEKKKDTLKAMTPQNIQEHFYLSPSENYEALKDDLELTNKSIVEYRKELEKIVFGALITE